MARLYTAQTLTLGAQVELPKEQAHYLSTVLRKAVGDSVRVFNGEQGEFRAAISAASKKGVTLHVEEQLRAPVPMPDVHVLFAPIKRARTEFILEKATELGASQLRPVITARTQFPKLRMDRARAQIIEAAEQTERLDIPQISAPQKLGAILSGWDSSRTLFFADEAGDCPMAQTVFAKASGSAALLVGPEGGFSDHERAQIRGCDFALPVSLGPRILRADTAALSMLTLWQAAQGDWKKGD